MPTWSQHNVQKHMQVYSSDNKELGRVEDVYEDSFKLHKGLLPFGDRYIPYNAISTIENERISLNMTEAEEQRQEWTIRPNFEAHEGDPVQLMYDRGHGVHDPFDEENPTKSS
jgi:hypothetical protein